MNAREAELTAPPVTPRDGAPVGGAGRDVLT